MAPPRSFKCKLLRIARVSKQFWPSDISFWVCQAILGKKRFNSSLCLWLWILILQRNVFSGGGIVLLVQALTTLGMVAIIMVVTSTTIRIPVATVEATLGLAGTEILDLYPTINKAMLQVQVSSLSPKLLSTDQKNQHVSLYGVNQAMDMNKFNQNMGISF